MRGRPARRARTLLLAWLAATTGCYTRAQVDRTPTGPQPWVFRALPYATYDGDEGFSGHLAVGWRHPANRKPPPVSKAVSLDARLAASGTRGVLLTYDAPGWWRNWRVLGIAGSERLRRVPFYGVGNHAPVVDSLPDLFYRYALLRSTAALTVQRRLTRPLRLHAAVQWRHYRAEALPDSTLFGDLVRAGTADTLGRANLELRAGLLFDTRDEEASPSRGVFLEVMRAHAASGYRYDRTLLSAREFIPFGSLEQWVLALRQTAELSSGSVPVFIAYERLTTWYPEDGFGGPTSLRLYALGRFVAPNRTVFSADLRYKLLDAPFPGSPVRIWLLGFADAGRLWDQGADPRLTDIHWSTGLGGRLQLAKSLIIGLDVGVNDAGFGFGVGTSFAF